MTSQRGPVPQWGLVGSPAPCWGWFGGWALAALTLLGAFMVGPYALALAVVLTVVLAGIRSARGFVVGVVCGVGLPVAVGGVSEPVGAGPGVCHLCRRVFVPGPVESVAVAGCWAWPAGGKCVGVSTPARSGAASATGGRAAPWPGAVLGPRAGL